MDGRYHLGSATIMTNRQGDIVQHYGYTAFGSERYKHNTAAFDGTSRYTGQPIDDQTGLYFYQSRYYDPQLGRFTQADTIVPSADTSQALNRYAYVKNNPLKFTDPDGHGWFSDIWKKIKGFIGTIITVALCVLVPGAGFMLQLAFSVIGSAVGTLASGGTWKSFAIGVGIGLAAGVIAGAITDMPISCGVYNALGDTGFKFAAGALTGAIAGGISSAVYGTNVGRGMLEGMASGAIGAGIGVAGGYAKGLAIDIGKGFIKGIGTTVEFIKDFMYKFSDMVYSIYKFPEAVIGDMIFGPLDEITILGADKDANNYWETPKYWEIKVKSYRFTKLTGNSYTISSTEIHVSQDTLDYLRNYSDSASREHPAYDYLKDEHFNPIDSTGRGNEIERHIAHEIGHACQARKLGPAYLPIAAPVTLFKSNQILNGLERDASRRGLYGGIVK